MLKKDVSVLLIAEELVNDWLDTKFKQELASDGDAEDTVPSIIPVSEAKGHLKYDRCDGKN